VRYPQNGGAKCDRDAPGGTIGHNFGAPVDCTASKIDDASRPNYRMAQTVLHDHIEESRRRIARQELGRAADTDILV
jgi:hypothetical protein